MDAEPLLSKQNLIAAFIGLIPIVFTAGGLIWSQYALAQDVADLTIKVTLIDNSLVHHQAIAAPHPLVDEKIRQLEMTSTAILTTLTRIEASQRKTERSVDRLCDKANINCQ